VLVVKNFDVIKAALITAGKAVVDFFKWIGSGLEAVGRAIVDFFAGIGKAAWENLMDLGKAIVGFFAGIWDGLVAAGQAIVGFFAGVWDGLVAAGQAIVGFFAGVWDGIVGFFSGVGEWFGGVFSAAAEAIQTAFSAVGDFFTGIFNGVWDTIKGFINMMIGGVNTIISGFNALKFNIPDWVPLIGGKAFGINIPMIPLLAQGGIAMGPTLAMIGEGREGEAVLPLSKLEGLLDGRFGPAEAAGNVVFEFKPSVTVTIQGNADEGAVRQGVQQGLAEAAEMTQERFDRLMDGYWGRRRRVRFA
jgi:phage-related protein